MLLTSCATSAPASARGSTSRRSSRRSRRSSSRSRSRRLILDLIGIGKQKELVQVVVTPPAAPVSVVAGQKATVRVPVAIGAAYNGNFTLKLEPSAGSDLKVPTTITLKEDDKDFVLEITAGFNKGQHSVRVTPDIGPARDVKVIVK